MPAIRPGVEEIAVGERRRGSGEESTWDVVLRSIALAAVALAIGIAASFLLDTRNTGYLGGQYSSR